MRELLNAQEVRVLGCLVEKERTTPEYYPLSLNALVNACNQKSNRDPAVSWLHADVAAVADGLRWKGWVVVVDEAGSRVEKYRHALAEKTGLSAAETAILAELMLRGAQTAGELRTRASRMAPLGGLDEVHEILRGLAEREEPWVVLLPRRRGFKERRYMHLLSGRPEALDEEADEEAPEPAPSGGAAEDRIRALEGEVATLRQRVAALETALGIENPSTEPSA
ncbi:MAG: YceH family protein [Candidatus Eisenbacteria bacterium]|nr:YceH family protein [Candidatus Eisenbacteria bacterium]